MPRETMGVEEFTKFSRLSYLVYNKLVTKGRSFPRYAAWYNGYMALHDLKPLKSFDVIIKKFSKADRKRIWTELVEEFGKRLDKFTTEGTK